MTIRMDPQQIMDSLSDCHFTELHAENCDELIFSRVDDDIYIDFATGATKMVLLFKEEEIDQVVKIPFTHQDDGCYESEGENETFSYFSLINAPYNCGFDYCASEVEIYELAKEAGVEQYFLENVRIGDLDGHPVYIQPKAVPFWNSEIKHMSREERKTLRDECREQGIECFNPEWIRDFILFYGIDELIRLSAFMEENDIYQDIHDGNLGYKDGKPIIFDYAGYYD